jgi:hypothetical protein
MAANRPPKREIPTPPASLGKAGKKLWRELWSGLPDGWELDERERSYLTLACGQADDVELLEKAISDGGLFVTGSTGQERLNPVLTELRQGRLAISRLLGQISLPAEDGEPETEASRRGRHAANSRWQNHRSLEARAAEVRRKRG